MKTVKTSVALYGAEMRILRKDEKRRLNSREMWIWRRMEKIVWTDRKTNVEELRDAERETINSYNNNIRRKKNWIGQGSHGGHNNGGEEVAK